MSEINEILDILELFQGVPKFRIEPNTTPGEWLQVVGDIDSSLLRAAALQYLSRDNQYTPIPTPGIIRDIAVDLEMLAAGIPSAGEAWGILVDAIKRVGPRFCEAGAGLRDSVINKHGEYWQTLAAYDRHVRDCDICETQPMEKLEYKHPIVAAAVHRLGGRSAIITENPAADRARFEDSYREIYLRERGRHAMLPEVRATVDSIQMQLESHVDPVHLIEAKTDGLAKRWQTRKDIA